MTTFTPRELNDNAMSTQKEMWKICTNNTIRRDELLEANLEAIYEVAMSICDPVLKIKSINMRIMKKSTSNKTHWGY